jgi:hypothetical protein
MMGAMLPKVSHQPWEHHNMKSTTAGASKGRDGDGCEQRRGMVAGVSKGRDDGVESPRRQLQ